MIVSGARRCRVVFVSLGMVMFESVRVWCVGTRGRECVIAQALSHERLRVSCGGETYAHAGPRVLHQTSDIPPRSHLAPTQRTTE